MKQTQTVSLGGYAFTMEVDALEKLQEYLSKVKESSSSDMRDELVSDIEERLAELFIERNGKGSVIDLACVQEAVSRIGVPSDDGSENASSEAFSQSSPEPETEPKKERKRFYRSLNDRILGGVCSGVAKYFGIDVLVIRLALAGLLLLSTLAPLTFHITGELILVYILLWIILPAPKTVEQQCEAEGKPFSFDEFKSAASSIKDKAKSGINEFKDRGPEIKDSIKSTAQEASTAPALRSFVRILGIFTGIVLTLVGISILTTTIFTVFAIPSDWFTVEKLFHSEDDIYTVTAFLENPYVKWSGLASIALCGIGMLYGGIKALFDLRAPKWHPGIIIMMLWFVATLLFCLFCAKHAVEFSNIFEFI